jgi:hypothetical protein
MTARVSVQSASALTRPRNKVSTNNQQHGLQVADGQRVVQDAEQAAEQEHADVWPRCSTAPRYASRPNLRITH